jgi:hypothetical protein
MKRAITFGTALVMALALATTALQAAPKKKVVIEDPVGDSNFVNDQGTGDGSFGDQTQADAGTVSDLIEVSLSNDAKNLYVEIITEAAPPAITGIGYRVRVNPDGDAGAYCVFFEAFFPGANNVLTEGKAHLRDGCEGGDPIPVDLLGTTLVIPRKENKAFAKGATLAAPQAQAFVYSGDYPTGVVGPFADTTTIGTDYKLVDKKRG